MATYPFEMVDVFGDGPFSGNPLAVVTLPAEIDTGTMHQIARWLNLSETTFLLPPTDPAADYRVRIFTLERELPFAGHPTLGTCHAWLRTGGKSKARDKIIQQCGAGLIPIRCDADRLSFAAPPLVRTGPVDDVVLTEVAGVLAIPRKAIVAAEWVDNGPGWVGIMLASAADVLALQPARAYPGRIDIGVVGFHPPGSGLAYEVRAFFSDALGGLIEDPVTGSLNASLAQWLVGSGQVTAPYVAAQGTRLGRQGRVHVTADAAGQLWIGGRTETRFAGQAEV